MTPQIAGSLCRIYIYNVYNYKTEMYMYTVLSLLGVGKNLLDTTSASSSTNSFTIPLTMYF